MDKQGGEEMISSRLRKQVKERAGGRCEVCCGTGDWRGMHIHHIDPKGMGGSKRADNLSNLVYLCAKCHSLKHRIVER